MSRIFCTSVLSLCLVIIAAGCSKVTHTGSNPQYQTCARGLVRCGTTCVNQNTDPSNCGACGTACAAGQVCSSGACATTCQAGELKCGSSCVNTANDANACGSCTNNCDADQQQQVCSSGACACPAGQTMCSGSCVTTSSDGNNCGACGTVCGAGKVCSSGSCVTNCATGETLCGTSCIPSLNTNQHCGSCTNACTGGETCAGSTCTCPSGQTLCSGACVNTQTSSAHCGSSCAPCSQGQSCQAGVCGPTCTSPNTLCGTSCVDTTSDKDHCGSCGTQCTSGQNCVAGACQAKVALGGVCTIGSDCQTGSCTNGHCTSALNSAHRHLFVTSKTYRIGTAFNSASIATQGYGTFASPADADAACQYTAQAAWWPGTWAAWISNSTQTAYARIQSRITSDTKPIYLLNETAVGPISVLALSTAANLTNVPNVQEDLRLDPVGTTQWAWIGNATAGNTCANWTNSLGSGAIAGNPASNTAFFNSGTTLDCNNSGVRLYCIQVDQ